MSNAFRKWTFIFVLGIALALWGCGRPTTGPQPQSPRPAIPTPAPQWDPVPTGVVLSRNFMSPASPAQEGFQLLPDHYRLGTKALAKAPPAWWLEMSKKAGLSEPWKSADFPLAYAGEFNLDQGQVFLVVQVTQSFTGDGFASPGPVLHLRAFLFSAGSSEFRLLSEESTVLGASSGGSFQYARLWAGEARERTVVFRTESGASFDCREISGTENYTLSVGDDGNMRWEHERR